MAGGLPGAGEVGGPRPSSERTRRDRMSRMVSLYPTSSRYLAGGNTGKGCVQDTPKPTVPPPLLS